MGPWPFWLKAYKPRGPVVCQVPMRRWDLFRSIASVTVFHDALYGQVDAAVGAAQCQSERSSYEFGHSLFQSAAPFARGTTQTFELVDAANPHRDEVFSPLVDGGDIARALPWHGLNDSHVMSFVERVRHRVGIFEQLRTGTDPINLVTVAGVVFVVCMVICLCVVLLSPKRPVHSLSKWTSSETSAVPYLSSSSEVPPSLGMHHRSHTQKSHPHRRHSKALLCGGH